MDIAMHRCVAALATSCLLGLLSSVGCASTEYINEGPGQPTPRAAGSLPPGSLGVCKQPFTKRPPIVSEELWDHAKPCTPRTPPSYVRIGYAKAGAAGTDPEAEQMAARVIEALASGAKSERGKPDKVEAGGGNDADKGNNDVTNAVRAVRAYAAKRDELRDRIARESAADRSCDFAYLLNTMSAARAKLSPDDACTAEVFDPETRADVCLFDAKRPEALWATSGWDCMTFTGAAGHETSCHRLCGYDDYCARQVSCASGDLDLLLCALGVCLPEPRAGFY